MLYFLSPYVGELSFHWLLYKLQFNRNIKPGVHTVSPYEFVYIVLLFECIGIQGKFIE